MEVGASVMVRPSIMVGGHSLDDVNIFLYLGSVLAYDGGTESDVKVRVGKATAVVF